MYHCKLIGGLIFLWLLGGGFCWNLLNADGKATGVEAVDNSCAVSMMMFFICLAIALLLW